MSADELLLLTAVGAWIVAPFLLLTFERFARWNASETRLGRAGT